MWKLGCMMRSIPSCKCIHQRSQTLTSYPYARALFEEALQLYPPVPLLLCEARRSDTLHGKKRQSFKPGRHYHYRVVSSAATQGL